METVQIPGETYFTFWEDTWDANISNQISAGGRRRKRKSRRTKKRKMPKKRRTKRMR